MTTKKTKIDLDKAADIAVARKKDFLIKGKTIADLIKEQGIKPIMDDKDFESISNKYPEWDDIDEFLKEAHRPWK